MKHMHKLSLIGLMTAVAVAAGPGGAFAADKKPADDAIQWGAPAAPTKTPAPAAATTAQGGYGGFDDTQRMWDDMARMHERMQAAMDSMWSARAQMLAHPALSGMDDTAMDSDVAETDKELVITCDLPGVDKDSIQISVDGSALLVRAVRDSGSDKSGEENGMTYHSRERSYGSVTRSFHIGNGVDPKAIKAAYKDGVLKIRVPKGKDTSVTVPIEG